MGKIHYTGKVSLTDKYTAAQEHDALKTPNLMRKTQQGRSMRYLLEVQRTLMGDFLVPEDPSPLRPSQHLSTYMTCSTGTMIASI